MPIRKVVHQTLSCPVCGASRPVKAFNVDVETGQRRQVDLVTYAFNYKVCIGGGYRGFTWEQHSMPRRFLQGLREQLVAALAQVDAHLADPNNS